MRVVMERNDPSRTAIEDEIERLMSILDGLDADPDLEDGGDSEPSLGWTETHGGGFAKLREGESPRDDREDDAGDNGEMDDDREWSLGSLEGVNQVRWSMGQSGDLEEESDFEDVNRSEFAAQIGAFELEPRFRRARRYRHDRDWNGVSAEASA